MVATRGLVVAELARVHAAEGILGVFDGWGSWSSWISGFFAFNNDKRRSENMGRGGGKDFERDRKDEKGKIVPQSALALLAFEVAVAT